MSDLELITELQAATPSLLRAAVAEAMDRLDGEYTDGYAPEVAGQMAWELLPGDERARDEAMEELLYTYVDAIHSDAQELVRYSREEPVRAELRALLAVRRDLASVGQAADPELLGQIAALADSLLGGWTA